MSAEQDFEAWMMGEHKKMGNAAKSKAIESIVEALKRQGYCVVSLKYRIAARIDSEDWQQKTPSADMYRRCYSKDQVTVSATIMKHLKSSHHGYDKYRPLDKVKQK